MARGIWTVVVLGLVEGLDRRGRIGAHRDVGDVHVLVLHLHETEVLLGLDLAGGGELGDRAGGRGLRSLTAGVGVHLGIHDENLDVAAGSEHVVQTAVADVVGPAVAAENPHGLPDEVVGDAEELFGDVATGLDAGFASHLQFGDELTHLFDALTLFVVLVDGLDLLAERLEPGRSALSDWRPVIPSCGSPRADRSQSCYRTGCRRSDPAPG